ncbi:MAG: peptide chain release factor N(5)-glutamine methyltransferase [Lachnospiraceae bacterium]|nr:peptide chain release factor N(5)-glutamine methyltransferase [Lachnospiraceae bacterium]
MNYSEAIRSGEKTLSEAGISEAALDARLLLEFVTGCSYADVLAHPDEEISDEQTQLFTKYINMRAGRIPYSYITGICEFMGLSFFVNEHVLIPRQDSECLVEEAMRFVFDGSDILDLCTGSGCLLISLMNYKNNCNGIGVDISEGAVEVAKKNAEARRAYSGPSAGSIRFYTGDLYDALPKETGVFDVIISNPPYIRTDVIPDLMPEVRDHEPVIALDGGDDGLEFYRRIAKPSKKYLRRGGMIFLEIGFDQAEDVRRILDANDFTDINIVKDFGGNDRVAVARLR